MSAPAPYALRSFVGGVEGKFLRSLADKAPWELTSSAAEIVAAMMSGLDSAWRVNLGVAQHATATIEQGAVVKGPCVLGPRAFVAAGAYLRDGVFCDEDAIIGPHCEIKSSFFLRGAKAAHLTFVGDSVIGPGANIEAGAMVANYRNERTDKRIRIVVDGAVIDCGVDKFGAVIGDGARIGANAVIAPGAVIKKAQIVPRLALVDQGPAD